MSTLFVLQGTTMERSLGSLSIPSASMSFVDTISVMICVILYDSLVVPFFKRIGRPISMLQRIGRWAPRSTDVLLVWAVPADSICREAYLLDYAC